MIDRKRHYEVKAGFSGNWCWGLGLKNQLCVRRNQHHCRISSGSAHRNGRRQSVKAGVGNSKNHQVGFEGMKGWGEQLRLGTLSGYRWSCILSCIRSPRTEVWCHVAEPASQKTVQGRPLVYVHSSSNREPRTLEMWISFYAKPGQQYLWSGGSLSLPHKLCCESLPSPLEPRRSWVEPIHWAQIYWAC